MVVESKTETVDEFLFNVQAEDFELQLDLDEEARILDSVGLDLDLEPINPQSPDWILMCDVLNGVWEEQE